MNVKYRYKISNKWGSWMTVSNSSHTHDNRYYTESEMNNILGNFKSIEQLVHADTNITLDKQSAYFGISWEDVSGAVNKIYAFILITGTNSIQRKDIFGVNTDVWRMMPTSGLTQGLYPNKDSSGNYIYAFLKMIKL